MKQNNKINLILLVNLGSPDFLTTRSIRKFLQKFLSDRRVVALPRLIWYPILYGIILLLRPKKLINKYREIWLYNTVSPLVHYTKLQAKQLNDAINDEHTKVCYAFSYSNPEISSVLDEVSLNHQITYLQVIPLYPQYSSTTTAAVFDAVANYYKTKKYLPSIRLCHGFANNKLYIKAIANKIKDSFTKNGRGDKLIFSYHSLPVNLCENGDTYYDECLLTTKLVAQTLNLHDSQYIMTFQSKFGSQKWISPATIDTIVELGCSGIKSLDIVCPGFVSDCLETLEEIAITNKQAFLNNGGVTYNYIQCLNDDNSFTDVLKDLLLSK